MMRDRHDVPEDVMNRPANPFRHMPSDELQRWYSEVSALNSAIQVERSHVSNLLSMVHEATLERTGAPNFVRGLYVTDHAIVRYIERYLGSDLLAQMEAEIVEKAKRGDCEVVVKEGRVVTILPAGTTSAQGHGANRAPFKTLVAEATRVGRLAADAGAEPQPAVG